MKRYVICLVIAGILVLGNSKPACSSILDPGGIGNRSLGMGSAVVGIPDDLMSAFYYNPAGLVLIKGTNAMMGSMFARAHLHYKSPEGYDGENTFDAVIPFAAYATDSCKPVTLGFGMYSTLGVGFKFKSNPAFSNMNGGIKSSAGVMFFSPTVAYQINPKLAAGIELNIGYGKSEMNMPTPSGYLTTDVDGFGYGTTIGLLYKLTPSFNLGLCWRSPMKISEEGDANLAGVNGDVNMDFYWPQMLTGGFAYKITPDLTFGFSLKWSDWPRFDRSKMEFTQFPALNRPFVQGSRDGFRLQTGAEYWINEKVALRIGYVYDRYSFDSQWISPGLLECSFHEARAGLGYKISNFQIDAGFNYTWFVNRDIPASINPNYPGKYFGKMPAGGIEITHRF